MVMGGLGILGCPADTSPLQSENQRLKKQLSKQESVIASLQEGNKVMQQQIDLLNQEGRTVRKKPGTGASRRLRKNCNNCPRDTKESKKLEALEAEKLKLSADARWLRTQRDHMRKGLKIQQAGGKSQELAFPFAIRADYDGISINSERIQGHCQYANRSKSGVCDQIEKFRSLFLWNLLAFAISISWLWKKGNRK